MRMKHEPIGNRQRQRVNLLLDREAVGEARELGINLSKIAGDALLAEIGRERTRRWQEENHAWIEGYDRWVEKNGLPLEKYRAW